MRKSIPAGEGAPNPEAHEIPKTVLAYLEEKRKTILNGYRAPDGKHGESCSYIAFEIADLLLKAGHHPDIRVVQETIVVSGMRGSKNLVPKVFGGKVEWSAHVVCTADGLVFDPLLEKPMPIEGYVEHVFGEATPMEIEFNTQEIVATLARRQRPNS